MNSQTYDPFKFSQRTNNLQRQVYDAALAKAEELAKTKENIKAFSMARKICKEAFQIFQNNLQVEFSEDAYKNLLELTILSRETLFFVELKEKITEILKTVPLESKE